MVANVIDNKRFPTLGTDTVAARDLIHGYARVLGDVLKVCRLKRKHWWHASLRPSLHGLSTGVVRSNRDFEIVLDLNTRRCSARTTDGKALEVEFRGLSAIALAEALAEFLSHCGVDKKSIDKLVTAERSGADGESFSGEGTRRIGRVFGRGSIITGAVSVYY